MQVFKSKWETSPISRFLPNKDTDGKSWNEPSTAQSSDPIGFHRALSIGA
jgi:hypothetical protein